MIGYDRITIDPSQIGGVPCIRHLRIPVATIVGLVGEGKSDEEILRDYPDIEPEYIRQALTYQPVVKVEKTAFLTPPEGVKTTFATGCYAAEAVRERQIPMRVA